MTDDPTRIKPDDAKSPLWQPEFSEGVRRALAKWPDVPACFGWLGLDARGRWRIDGGLISHPGAVAFLAAHYACDEHGRWYVQNGPQRAFVALDLAPWVLRVGADGALSTHTGRQLDRYEDIHVTPDGEILLTTPLGLAAIDDRDLAAFAATLEAPGSDALEVLSAAAAGRPGALTDAGGVVHRVAGGRLDDLAARHGCERRPAP
jgi:hypothetical protein